MAAHGALPPDIHCARDYERLAASALPAPVFAHLMDGTGRARAVETNLQAFDALRIVPRVLRDLKGGSTACRFAGRDRPHPIWLAPVAHQVLFHPGAEVETARAAGATGAGMVLSTLSSQTLEEVAGAGPGDRWFQLYFQPSRDATLDLCRRAEAAGYGALVVTVDAPVRTPGLATLRAGYAGGERAANLDRYDRTAPATTPGQSRVFQGAMRNAPTWVDIAWLREQTRLAVWLKGVLHPDDARAAIDAGVAGLIVSNHGGRTLDSAPPSLAALPRVREAVGAAVPLMVDGGVRSGEDVFKAVARGADAVLVGRLQACALAVGGALGVAHMLRLLREELEICMALAGCATLADVAEADMVDAGEA
jgi:isopentenyl diphosphate isomerase/L-lactate dehydrogenase-like FMN-dependent dehydrogenase